MGKPNRYTKALAAMDEEIAIRDRDLHEQTLVLDALKQNRDQMVLAATTQAKPQAAKAPRPRKPKPAPAADASLLALN